MTDYKKYGKSAPAFNEAIALLNKSENPIVKICSSCAYWIPLQFVYVAMVKNKDLVRISELPEKERVEIWLKMKQANPSSPTWEKWKQKMVMQAILVYLKIKE